MTWQVIDVPGIVKHVVPFNDLRPHRISTFCWCKPTRDSEDEKVFIHNAMDERAPYEQTRAN